MKSLRATLKDNGRCLGYGFFLVVSISKQKELFRHSSKTDMLSHAVLAGNALTSHDLERCGLIPSF